MLVKPFSISLVKNLDIHSGKKGRNLSLFVKRTSVIVIILNEQYHLIHAVTTVWKDGGHVCDYGHCHLQGLLR